MKISELSEPILVEQSHADSRGLIMPHQQEAVDSMTRYYKLLKDLPNRNGIVVMPTGSGKTYTAVTWLLSQGVANGYRVVWLVHRQELVEQTYWEFRKQTPLLKGTGVKKIRILPISSYHMRMVMANKADVYVCSVASVASKYGYRFIDRMMGAAGKRKLIIVVDEAHHAVAANYQKVIKRMSALNPNRILLGLTATPKRMQDSEQGKLQEMFNINCNLKHNVGKHGYVYEVTLKQLLLSGFLAEPIYEKVNTEIIGEIAYNCSPEDEAYFNQYGELSEKIKSQIAKSSARNKLILQHYLNQKEKYGKTLIFAVNQLHAETLCNEFQKAGVKCDYAVSSRSDAQDVILKFKNNEFDVLINVQILTEGSDVPDIQTIFLTRQTNSDSLLMQMIGRGLRGVKSKGTKTANIVAFHDVWDTFAHFLDPGALDIFLPTDDGSDTEEVEGEQPVPITPDEEMLKLLKELGTTDDEAGTNGIETNSSNGNETVVPKEISPRELYLKLYALMKASLASSSETPEYPCGWYSVIDEDGNDVQVLVFESQLEAYHNIKTNIALIKNHLSVDGLIGIYFSESTIQPETAEMDYILDYISETGTMPPYFTFEQREVLDPARLSETVNRLFDNDEDKEEWLKKLFNSSPMLQQIYKIFYAFKKTVFDAAKAQMDSVIVTTDERKTYEIIDDYFDLPSLLNEVKEMYPLLHTDGLAKIAWSNNIVKSWFALCQRITNNGEPIYQIHINKILSSPKVDKEVVKYLIFHELLHENGYWDHDEEFRKREWQYPNSADLDGFLDTLALEYNMDELNEKAVYNEVPPIEIGETSDAKSDEPPILVQPALEHDEPAFNSAAPGVVAGFKYCRNCGNKLPTEAKFCDKCGTQLNY